MGCKLRTLAIAVGLGIGLFGWTGGAEAATLRWFGHAFFLVTSPQGVRVALDPFGDIGYPLPDVAADIVTVSHGHGDHNNPDLLTGAPVVLRGLMAGGADWNAIDFRTKDVRISALPAYHDDVRGLSRGLNSIFIVEIGGLRLAHLSDIGHTLSAETLEDMGRIDILLVPVGGIFSIDGRQAIDIMTRLRPAITIPIHYKTAATAIWPIKDESAFLSGLNNVRRLDATTISVTPETLPDRPEVWVMQYR